MKTLVITLSSSDFQATSHYWPPLSAPIASHHLVVVSPPIAAIHKPLLRRERALSCSSQAMAGCLLRHPRPTQNTTLRSVICMAVHEFLFPMLRRSSATPHNDSWAPPLHFFCPLLIGFQNRVLQLRLAHARQFWGWCPFVASWLLCWFLFF